MGRVRFLAVATIVMALCSIAFMASAQPDLSLNSATAGSDGTASLSLSLSGGTEPYAGVNATIVFPDGVNLVSLDAGAGLPAGFSLDGDSDESAQTVSVIAYSDTATFTGGTLLTMNLEMSGDAVAGTYSVDFVDGRHAISNEEGSASVTHSVSPGSITIQWRDTDDDGLPDYWEIEHFGDIETWSGEHDPDGDLFTNAEEFAGNTDPLNAIDHPQDTPRILAVSPAALVVGGSPITIAGMMLNAGCRVLVNGQECADVVYDSDFEELSATVPPGEGSATVRVEDPDAGTYDELSDAIVYTSDPFSSDLDTTPGIVRSWTEDGTTVQYGYIPDFGVLTISTPQGTVLSVPSTLRGEFDAAFIIVRSADEISSLHPDTTIVFPDDMAASTPVFDIGGFVYTGDTSLHLDGPFTEPVTVVLPLTSSSPDEDVYLGLIETDLGEGLSPEFTTAGSQQELTVGTTPGIVDTDTVTFEIDNFTTYIGLSMVPVFPPGDVNNDETVNAVDVQLVINDALGLSVGWDCDINDDDTVNAIDVQLVINAALGIDISI